VAIEVLCAALSLGVAAFRLASHSPALFHMMGVGLLGVGSHEHFTFPEVRPALAPNRRGPVTGAALPLPGFALFRWACLGSTADSLSLGRLSLAVAPRSTARRGGAFGPARLHAVGFFVAGLVQGSREAVSLSVSSGTLALPATAEIKTVGGARGLAGARVALGSSSTFNLMGPRGNSL
jgi:hypothetical protein